MRSLVRLRASTIAGVLLAVGLGLGGSVVFAGTQAAAADAPASVFNASNLMPGDTLTSHLDIPSGDQPLTPYLQAHDLVDGCVAGATCTADGPKLSSSLLLVVTAPDGERWRGTPADLLTRVLLPGGQIAHSGSTRYGISLEVPTALTDSSEDRTIALELEWGGLDGSDQIVTSVLGETFTKGDGTSGQKPTSVLAEQIHKGSLPFTGSYLEIELFSGAGLVAAGSAFWLVSRRRRRPASGTATQ